MFEGITAGILATAIVAYFLKSKFWIQFQLKKYIAKLIYQIENYNDFKKKHGYEYISIISDFNIASHFTPPTAVEYLFDDEEHKQSSLKVHNNVERFIEDRIFTNELSYFFIIGEFGVGKTALVTRLSFTIGKKFITNEKSIIPILIPMSDIKSRDFFSESCRLMRERYDVSQFRLEFLISGLRSGKILLILDGLDEYVRMNGNRFPSYELKALQEKVTQKSKIIITSRPNIFHSPEEMVGYFKKGKNDFKRVHKRVSRISSATVLEIKNFSDSQIIDAVSRRGKACSKFESLILKNRNLKQLAKQPILLDMILEILPESTYREKISSLKKFDIVSLYEVFISHIISRDLWRLEGVTFSEEKAISICEKIAIEMFNKQKETISEKNLIDLINQTINSNNRKELKFESIVDQIVSSLFLKVTPKKEYRFIHRSVMEFFVAKGLVRAIRAKDFISLNVKRIVYHEAVSHFARSILKEQDLKILIELLGHDDPWVRFVSAHYLSRMNEDTAIEEIQQALQTEQNFIVRREFYIALAFLGKVEFFHNFMKEINNDEANAKNTKLIVDYFSTLHLSLEGCSQRLIEREDYPTREMIIKFIGIEGQRQHIPVIRRYLTDEIQTVREEAHNTINLIKDRVGKPTIIKALLCDVDGVIVDSIDDHIRAWKWAFKESINLEFNDSLIKATEGLKSFQVAKQILISENRQLSKQQIKTIVDKKRQRMKKIDRISIFPETVNLIKKAKSKGVKIVFITASNKQRAESIAKAIGSDCVDSIVSGNDTKKGKPSPEPYELGMKNINLSYNEVIAIENAPFGIDSAQAANIYCVGLTTTLDKKILDCADFVVDSPSAILELLK